MSVRWSREEWRERLKEIPISEMAFALACNFSMSTLGRIMKNDPRYPVHENSWNRAMDVYARLKGQSKAAG